MANVKVSELPAASAASTSQEFEVNDSGTSKKVTGSQIKSFVKDGLVLTDITDVTASITELNYVDGVTSSVQDQLNDKFKQRTITGTADQITVTNGDGVAGNPTIAAVIASQAEAEAGTGVGLMTSERVAQAIDAQVLPSDSMTLLGTLTTTSGTTQTLSGLNLTSYKILYVNYAGVSCNTTGRSLTLSSILISADMAPSNTSNGYVVVNLISGMGQGQTRRNDGANTSSQGFFNIFNGTTSISFAWNGTGSFDAGSILVYGVK